MTDDMRRTIDTFTGKDFRWNTTVFYAGKSVPARCTTRDLVYLHPSRVKPELLAELNPGKDAT